MYTDVYFTNRTPNLQGNVGLAFFQRQTATSADASRIFRTIETCPSGWSQHTRIFWGLNYRLVSSSGNISPPYVLATCYKESAKKFMLCRDGTISMVQNYRNGCQEIEFEQLKGEPCTAIRLYRGECMIAELYFSAKVISFKVDTTIHLLHFFSGHEGDPVPKEGQYPSELTFDYTGIKKIELCFNAYAQKQLEIGKILNWT